MDHAAKPELRQREQLVRSQVVSIPMDPGRSFDFVAVVCSPAVLADEHEVDVFDDLAFDG